MSLLTNSTLKGNFQILQPFELVCAFTQHSAHFTIYCTSYLSSLFIAPSQYVISVSYFSPSILQVILILSATSPLAFFPYSSHFNFLFPLFFLSFFQTLFISLYAQQPVLVAFSKIDSVGDVETLSLLGYTSRIRYFMGQGFARSLK